MHRGASAAGAAYRGKKRLRRIQKETVTLNVSIKKIDAKKQIVYGEVWIPNELDTYGDFMTAEDTEIMAHRYMQLVTLRQSIDTNHDEESNGSYPVESFIARAGDPDFQEGAWVLGTKIADEEIWAEVQRGELNGYSFQAMVKKKAVVVNLEVMDNTINETGEAPDGHTHLYFVRLNSEGLVMGGRTSFDAGHSHEIRHGTATEEANGHSHRITIGE